MSVIDHANRWNDIIERFYEIESNPKNSIFRRFYARKYQGFAVVMWRMYCYKAVQRWRFGYSRKDVKRHGKPKRRS